MKALHYTVSWLIRLIVHLICRISAKELRKIPRTGPAIIVTNHINFLEVPVIYTNLMPRKLTALVKAENWSNPIFGFLGNLWNGIPLSRGVVDRKAFTLAREALDRKEILVIAPEGTRSGNGNLRRGNPGIVLLAADAGVPIIPIAHVGGENFWRNIKSLRRTVFSIRVGRPFLVDTGGAAIDREARKRIADEIMLRLAVLLPESHRGYYQNKMTDQYQFLRLS
jgi:1-acyl-sn-glycerol-3-phosphate acyltransferase